MLKRSQAQRPAGSRVARLAHGGSGRGSGHGAGNLFLDAGPQGKSAVIVENDPTSARTLATAMLILLAPIAVVLAVWWPGHGNGDFFAMYRAGIEANYSNWYAPLVLWLIHATTPLGFGPGWVLTSQTVLACLGVYGMLRAALSPVRAAITTAIVILVPFTFDFMANLSRDLWMWAFWADAVGCIVAAYNARSRGRRRLWLVASLAAAVCAIAARQNAITLIPPLTLAWVYAWRPRFDSQPEGSWWKAPFRRPRWKSTLAWAAAVTVGLYLVVAGLSAVMVRPAQLYPSSVVYLYDLAAISEKTNDDVIPRSLRTQPEAVIRAGFHQITIGGQALGADPVLVRPRNATEMSRLKSIWWDAVESHPLAWAAVRMRLFMLQLGVSTLPGDPYDETVQGSPLSWPPSPLDKYGRDYSYTIALNQYNQATSLQSPWIFQLITVVAAPLLLRDADPQRRTLGWVCVSCWTLNVGLMFTAPSAHFRYELPVYMMGLVVAIVIVHDRIVARRHSRAAPGALAASGR